MKDRQSDKSIVRRFSTVQDVLMEVYDRFDERGKLGN